MLAFRTMQARWVAVRLLRSLEEATIYEELGGAKRNPDSRIICFNDSDPDYIGSVLQMLGDWAECILYNNTVVQWIQKKGMKQSAPFPDST